MIVWLDAQLPPGLAAWMHTQLKVEAAALRDLGLRDASDITIFDAARKTGAVLVSKDSDFVDLILRLGVPPQLVWLTCGNVTNARLEALFSAQWSDVAALLRAGEPIVELGD